MREQIVYTHADGNKSVDHRLESRARQSGAGTDFTGRGLCSALAAYFLPAWRGRWILLPNAGALRHSIFVCELSLFLWHHPYLFCLAMPSLRPKEPGKALLFALGVWSVAGLILPQFYRLQTYLYGAGTDVRTLTLKIITDQFGYTAFFASPYIAITHLWKDRGYRWSAIAPLLGRGWYRRLVIPNLVMNWVVWIPSLIVIYSLPTTLRHNV